MQSPRVRGLRLQRGTIEPLGLMAGSLTIVGNGRFEQLFRQRPGQRGINGFGLFWQLSARSFE